ncbi:hypothetical protein GCM10009416_45860 [Craurococcus roseus]|uniref:DUF2125 domain-containing protein n=1 Tax=Craurococcus roseus TaxID=77585 RepID=A0ABN1G2T7_9PROT
MEHGPPRRGGWPFSASLALPGFRMEGGAGLLPGGVDWRTEALTLRVSPSRPDRLALEAPGRHRLRLGEAELPPFTAGRLDAALPLRPDGDGPPDEAGATARALRVGAVEVASASVDLDARRGGASAGTLRASAAGVVLPPALPGTDRLGRVVHRIGLDLALTGAVPPGGDPARRAAAWRDGGGALEVRAADARWGEAAASASATLALDGALQPAGTGVLRLAGGEALLEAASAAGLLSPFNAAAAGVALRALSRPPPEGGPARAELPLALRDRTLRLGPIALVRFPALDWTRAGPGIGAGRP